MRKLMMLVLAILMTVPAWAVEGNDIAYAGGSVTQLNAGATGTIDLTRNTGLVLKFAGREIEVPYAQITEYEHSQEVAVHLGLAPAIAVGLVKKRRKNHYLQLTWQDSDNVNQVAVLEIAKTMPRVVMPLLAARAPAASCKGLGECPARPHAAAQPAK